MNQPFTSVRAVLFPSRNAAERGGPFYVVREDDDAGTRKLPGGNPLTNKKETPKDAINREIGEELDLLPDEIHLQPAGCLDDGEVADGRVIFVGWVRDGALATPNGNVCSLELIDEAMLSEGEKYRHHILSAVRAGRLALDNPGVS